jgi:hypothetical protein
MLIPIHYCILFGQLYVQYLTCFLRVSSSSSSVYRYQSRKKKQSAKILLLPSKFEIIIFTLCSPFSLCYFNFAIANVVALNLFYMSFVDWFMASFLYGFQYSSRSSNYCDSSFMLLKALAKCNSNLFNITYKSEKE